MTATHHILQPDGWEEVTERVRLYTLDVGMMAEEGATFTSQVALDDPDGTFDVNGHRLYVIYEDSVASSSNTRILTAYVATRQFSRGPGPTGHVYPVGAGSVVKLDVTDGNTVLHRRVLVGADCKRPAETDVARVQWLVQTNEAGVIDDFRWLSTDNPVPMDAVDYTGQYLSDVLNDCAQQSGKNYWVSFVQDEDTWSLWYDFAASSNYSSPIRLSNFLSDIDETTTFAISPDSTLTIDPSRVYSGVYLPYDGGYVYKERPATRTEFARRDTVMSAENVKTKAKADSRATRYLRDIATEEHTIVAPFEVPAAQVNDLREGQRVQIRVSHFPGYSTDFVWMRCVKRQVQQISEERYLVTAELKAPPPPGEEEAASGVLYMTKGPYGGFLHFGAPGDTPPPGYATVPTMSGLTAVTDSGPNASWPYIGWDVTGTGTLDLRLACSVAGVLVDNIEITFTLAILLNGSVVGSTTYSLSGFLQYYGNDLPPVEVTALAVEPGDEIRARLTWTPTNYPTGVTVPAGTGQVGEGFYVTGGSLA